MAVTPRRPPANGFVATMRKVYHPIGFSKGYNFILWFIFAGALMGFGLARAMYLNYSGVYCAESSGGGDSAAPGECWVYDSEKVYGIGIRLHLFTIIPASILVCFQFVPVIRYRLTLFHRINGYLVVLLSIVGSVGALLIARISFGGRIETQVFVGFLAILFIVCLALAFYNIKKLQIEQHRAWMLRAWFYAASIVTSRFIMILGAMIQSIPGMGPYYEAMQCDYLRSFFDNWDALREVYPVCTSPETWTAVEASMTGGGPENVAGILHMNFGTALWLALGIHAFGIEIYLRLTPAESERLRNVSYQRQLEAAFKNPGRAGLTAERLGDAEDWVPAAQSQRLESPSEQASDKGLPG